MSALTALYKGLPHFQVWVCRAYVIVLTSTLEFSTPPVRVGLVTGADPRFSLGGGAHSFFFLLQNTNCIRKPPGHLSEGCAPPTPSP